MDDAVRGRKHGQIGNEADLTSTKFMFERCIRERSKIFVLGVNVC